MLLLFLGRRLRWLSVTDSRKFTEVFSKPSPLVVKAEQIALVATVAHRRKKFENIFVNKKNGVKKFSESENLTPFFFKIFFRESSLVNSFSIQNPFARCRLSCPKSNRKPRIKENLIPKSYSQLKSGYAAQVPFQ